MFDETELSSRLTVWQSALLAPDESTADMEQNPTLLLPYLLASVLGAALFPASGNAVPAHQSPYRHAPNGIPAHGSGEPTAFSKQNPSLDEIPVRLSNVPSGENGCRRNRVGEDQLDIGHHGKMCIDPFDVSRRLSVRLGRRIGTSTDILGEVDGLRMDYRLSDALRLNGIAGFPVLSEEDQFNTTRQMFGISASTNRFFDAWNLNGFVVEQQQNGNTNEKYLGGTVRYLQPGRSMLVHLDYDVAGTSWTTSTASGAWRLPFKTTISTTLDHRNRPMSAGQQKYLKHQMSSLEGWTLALPEDRLAYYTNDGRGDVGTLAVGLSHAVSRRIRLSGDIAVLNARSNENGNAVITISSREYIYHSKLSGKSLLFPGDHSNLDVRHDVTETGRISTATLDTKYAINRFWNIMPKLRSAYQIAAPKDAPRWVTSPILDMEYRRNEKSHVEIEAGGEWTTGIRALAKDSRSSYFLSLAYQAKF